MTVTEKLISLREHMINMAHNDMGDLSHAQAGLFHIATEAIEALIDSIYDAKAKEEISHD
jgi:hypothetical protein